MPYRFTQPAKTVIGEGAFEQAAEAVASLGSRAFIVTGPHVSAQAGFGAVTQALDSRGREYHVFTGITGEPSIQMLHAGAQAYRESGCDYIIGFGGGSQLDGAKAIAVMGTSNRDITCFAGTDIAGSFPPLALIPTTAGTGSEATKYFCVTDDDAGVKYLLQGEQLLPRLAIVDPAFTLSAPPQVTAATGMDALTHAVEAYTSRRANPLTDMYALSAVKRIFAWLPQAYRDGSHKKARGELMLAAYQAGVCINNASTTIVHGMSRPIGALFHVPHGLSNAMLVCACLRFALDGCYSRFAELARAIGAASRRTPDKQAAERFIEKIGELCQALAIQTLSQYGVDEAAFAAQIDKMASDAAASGSPANTIKPVSKEDMCAIYRSLWT